MRFGGVLTTTLLMAVLGAPAAWAGLETNGPAEFPPASYQGRQYVDSAGCVFVRAGYGGSVNWVPRIGRDRKQLCGYKPSLPAGAPVLDVAKSAPAPAPTPAVPAPAPARVAAAPAPVPAAPARPMRAASPFEPTPGVGKPMPTIALTNTPPRIGRPATPALAPVAMPAPPVAVPTPGPVKMAAAPAPGRYVSPYALGGDWSGTAPSSPAVTPAPYGAPVTILAAETVQGAATTCPNLSPVAQRYTLSDGRSVVRCGPQTEDPVGFINRAAVPGLVVASTTPVAGTSRAMAAPRVSRAPVTQPIAPLPMTAQQGYAASSPYQGTLAPAPDAVYLRHPAGPTTLAPVIVATKVGPSGYKPAFDDGRLNPYRGPRASTGDVQQAQVWTNQVPARPLTATTPASARVIVSTPMVQYREAAQVLPVSARPSTKSVAPVAAPGAAAAVRYVQVGTFGVAGNAEAAKARLRALGLPVSSARITRAGKPMTIVYAGPMPGGDAGAALGSVRAAGFGDAILR
ncbi:SPOR domain-containing protein [Sinirhodobacter ferrireducens]|uniref:SPOR domain-containing protein n=2 Tax=Paenirhodobacter ferrireducens TaxID=1215032 RepID=A0A443LLF6_9RHOB|nr:SPOR domain-containing protein [Sinirhodobacter ferrireducens]